MPFLDLLPLLRQRAQLPRSRVHKPSTSWCCPAKNHVRASCFNSTKPVARSRTPTSRTIGRIGKSTFIDGKASTSDALREPRSEALEFGDPLIDPFGPSI